MNNRFFHTTVNPNRRRNQFTTLETAKGWVEIVSEVEGAVRNPFENIFKENYERRPRLDDM